MGINSSGHYVYDVYLRIKNTLFQHLLSLSSPLQSRTGSEKPAVSTLTQIKTYQSSNLNWNRLSKLGEQLICWIHKLNKQQILFFFFKRVLGYQGDRFSEEINM